MRILLMICTLMGSSFFISDKAFADQVGTGVFINSVGDVLTNRHVIENCGFIQVRLPNKEWRNAEISLVSSSFDLAILKTDWATDVFASLSVTEDDYPIIPTPGDDIITYGYSYEKAGMEGWGRVGLGRRLIIPQPDANGRELDHGHVVRRQLVVAGGDTTKVFDLIEEPLDEVARLVESGAEANRILAV